MAPRKPAADKEAAVEAAAVEAPEPAVETAPMVLTAVVGINDGAAASTAGPTGNGYTDEQEDLIREAITGPGWEPAQ